MNTSIENARITGTMLGKEDHGILTFELFLDFGGSCCAFGGYALDGYDKDTNKRVVKAAGLRAIVEILDCVGVEKWEDLPGKYIRCESDGWGGKIVAIGNILQDKWFRIREFFEKAKDE
ncbi:MAG: hypothetical protein PHR82_09175 [Endomicrobiaceae bacterium]|nr:hypothetical protein [Endomicrobiaceae bacterium]